MSKSGADALRKVIEEFENIDDEELLDIFRVSEERGAVYRNYLMNFNSETSELDESEFSFLEIFEAENEITINFDDFINRIEFLNIPHSDKDNWGITYSTENIMKRMPDDGLLSFPFDTNPISSFEISDTRLKETAEDYSYSVAA